MISGRIAQRVREAGIACVGAMVAACCLWAVPPAHAAEEEQGPGQAIERVYSYDASTSSGVVYRVDETVTFGEDGRVEKTHMHLVFPDEASQQRFVESLAEDFDGFELISQAGGEAEVRIDLAFLKLDVAEYEDALRYSVDNLVGAEEPVQEAFTEPAEESTDAPLPEEQPAASDLMRTCIAGDAAAALIAGMPVRF